MRLRIFLLLFLILVVIAVGVVVVVSALGGLSLFTGGDGNNGDNSGSTANTGETTQDEPGLPTPTATPELRFVEVLVATVRLQPGARITSDLVEVELRPEDNVAVRAGYTFSDPAQLEGQIVGTEIAPGQAILSSMLALNAADLTSFGSDLSLYIPRGNVAVAFPINQFSGIAYAMRPGDRVDVMMSMSLQRVDEEFQSPLPNVLQVVDPEALLDGREFLFQETLNGRLEFIPEINAIALIIPGGDGTVYNREVTQLTIQQAEVLWVGTWEDPRVDARNDDATIGNFSPDSPQPTATPFPARVESQPDLVVLSMTAQDALVLKWALETGINVDLTLRSQGDSTVFVTTSVSLPQMVEQSGVTIPEQGEFREFPPISSVPTPGVPSLPPSPPLVPEGQNQALPPSQ
jgi:Flp pilus assembly protein CpaB